MAIGAIRCARRAREAAPPTARRLADPRPAAVVPGRRRSAPLRVRRLEPGGAARHRRPHRRVRDPHDRPGSAELLRLPTDPIAPPPRRERRPIAVAGVLGQLRLLPVGSGVVGQHEHDAGLPARRRRVLADVRGGHGRRRGRRHARRSVRAEGADARDGADPRERDGHRADRQEHRLVRLQRGLRAVRDERAAEAGAGARRASRARRVPCRRRRPAGQGPRAVACVRRRARPRMERRSPDAARPGVDHRRRCVRSLGDRRDLGRDQQRVGDEARLLPAANRHVRRAARGRGHGHRDAHGRPA